MPLGCYYIEAFKENHLSSPSFRYILVDSNLALGDLTLAPGETNLVYQQYDMVAVTSTLDEYTPDAIVDGNINTIWRSLDSGQPEDIMFSFDGARNIHQVVLYWEIARSWLGMRNGDIQIDVMYNGDPLDPASWNSNASTVLPLTHTCYSYEIQPGVGISLAMINAPDAVGLRVRTTNRCWWDGCAQVREIEINGL
jgi:hypothetical protein